MKNSTSTVFIQDNLTKEYYCVEMTETTADGEPTAGPNDFPYWSSDKNDACPFTMVSAEIEMSYQDLTCDGTREPVIIYDEQL